MPGRRWLGPLVSHLPEVPRWTSVARYLPGVGAAAVVVALASFGLLEEREYWSLERFFELRGARPPATPIVIVSIDESSFIELDQQWPFPRALHADLLKILAAGRPRAIGVDLIFDVPSARGPADDAALGEAVSRAGNVVLGSATRFENLGFIERTDPNKPLPVIRRGAAAVGPVNLVQDVADGHVRRAPLFVEVADAYEPGFDVQLHRLAQLAGLPVRPLPAVDTVLINFRGPPRTFPWVPYYRVVKGEVEPEFFRDKIVLIGPTSEVLHDVFPTAFARGSEEMPGVEIHANVLETYIRGNRIREVPRAVSTTVAAAAALFGGLLVIRLHAARALATALLVWVAVTLIAYLGFLSFDVWMRGMAGSLGLVLGYGATVVENFVREQREKRRLSQFFSPEVLREVVRNRDEAIGSSRRLVTVLFSDIRGFTSLSERLQPEQVAEMLREYLTEMTEIVFRHGGTVDKYIGDCVMALYNVPFEDPAHAVQAVRTGLEFQEKTLEVSRRWEAKLGITIRNGVGINTGEAVVGTMGSRQRLEYTAIGDTINLGARLESITKEYAVGIIISEFTHRYLNDEFMTRELGEVTVKGKTQPVKIFAVLPGSLRKYPRAALEAAATLTIVGSGEQCRVTTRDIGEGGLAVAGLPDTWKTGTPVEVRCEGGRLPRPISAEGVVVWRREGLAGIGFTGLAPDTGPVVADYVARSGKMAP